MSADQDLVRALVAAASNYREKAPVFEVAQRPGAQVAQEAIGTVAQLWKWFRDCSIRPDVFDVEGMTLLRIPEQGHVKVFHPSGAVAAEWRGARDRGPIAQNDRTANVAALTTETERAAQMIAQRAVSDRDELRFEKLWKIKATGITLRGERAPVSLLEVVGAYRRYLEGLPVLGRASVFVTLGAEAQVTQWGIDWRRVRAKPIMHTSVINPDEGARRIMDDLFSRRPEKPLTLDDFEPASFALGYVSVRQAAGPVRDAAGLGRDPPPSREHHDGPGGRRARGAEGLRGLSDPPDHVAAARAWHTARQVGR